ncbi:MAG: Extracellular ribonuclease precursor [Tenericutes bacterium ADurb.Bin087]|nr:MAG: Extracellular ribonuclease precursor [Tenericutes bacterium ADurb.Bin087]
MKIRRLLLALIGVTLLASCDPPTPSVSDVPESEIPSVSDISEVTSIASEVSSEVESSTEESSPWVEPEPVLRPAEIWNFEPLPAYTGDFWATIDFSLRGEALRQAIADYMWSKFYVPGVLDNRVTYNVAYDAIRVMDADPNKAGNVLSVYDLRSHPHAGYNYGRWNREHVFPQSKLADGDDSLRASGNVKNISSDIANLFACDADLNEHKSNHSYIEWNYAEDPERWFPYLSRNTAGELVDAIVHYGYSPTPIVRGEIARAQMYMVLMYPDRCSISENFQIADMIRWDQEWAPTVERDGQRQLGIEQYQKIRNPFIDNRNLSCYIWGDTNRAARKLCAGIY